MRKIFYAAMLLVLTNYTAQATEQTKFEWPKHGSSSVFKALLKAYNADDMEALQAFVNQYYPEKKIKGQDVYWRKVFSEYGKLKPFKVDEEKFHGLPAIWFRGEKTKGWLKMVLMVNKEGTQIQRAGLFRKMRPIGLLPPYSPISNKELGKYLDGYMNTLSESDLFSGAVLVAKGNEIIFKKAYGYSDKANLKKNTLETTFGIASTTKTFTALAIMQLVDKGKIKLSDPMSKFIPEYPKYIAEQVTVHHLLTHTSGIEFDDYDPFYYETLKAKNINEMLAIQLKYIEHMNGDRHKNFKVLDKYDYTNDGFVLLGAIIERASGQTYAKYIEENIFEPAEMKFSIVDNEKLIEKVNKTKKYSFNNADMKFQLGPRIEAIGSAVSNIIMPAAGLHSNVTDLHRYFTAVNQHKIISEKSKELMFNKHVVRASSDSMQSHIYYGYGFVTTQAGKALSVGHGGVDYGVGSSFEYYPEQDIYVIVLSNYGSMAGNVIADHVRDLIEPND